jgi:lysophospholipase L1-like esterase
MILSAMRILTLVLILFAGQTASAAPKLVLNNGDRVLWLGGTLIEREQIYGYWEAMLTASFADRDIKFRDLGWSGDTVWADSRGMFDAPAEGYKRMLDMVKEFKPTLIVIAYGGNESFGGPAKLEAFVAQFKKLLGDLKTPEVRFAFVLPVDMEPAATPIRGSAAAFNKGVVPYREAVRKLAAESDSPVIDLATPAKEEAGLAGKNLTSDGLHLTAVGYWAYAHRLRDQCEPTKPGITLPMPSGAYPPEPSAASADRLESLRTTIIAKNELFFHRWRPQNFTYLFGFRKHEQGNNAVEIPKFDPLVEKQEQAIAELRKAN